MIYRTVDSKERLNKSIEEIFPERDDGHCRVCKEPIAGSGRSYCSDRCEEIASGIQKKFLWSNIRSNVLDRDDHTCQECGLTKDKAYRAYWHLRDRAEEKADNSADFFTHWSRYNIDKPKFHVTLSEPLEEGDHPFDEDMLETVCDSCKSEVVNTVSETEESKQENDGNGGEEEQKNLSGLDSVIHKRK